MVEELQQHKIIYPDGKEEIINHYGMFPHQSGGFAFYQEPIENIYTDRKPYIFISGANVRKIIPFPIECIHDFNIDSEVELGDVLITNKTCKKCKKFEKVKEIMKKA